MSSIKCPQCGFINWVSAEACKRCRLPINGSDAPAANSWEESWNSDAGEPVHQWSDQGGYHGTSYDYAGTPGVALKSGLAIASLVVGIISMMACGLLGLGSITGLVLGIVALGKARKSPTEYGGKGFAVAGIVLSVVSFLYIGIVMAIAIPNVIASYHAANDGSAIRSLRTLAYAESTFQCSNDSREYGTMQELAEAGLIDASLASGMKNNYVFEIKTDRNSFEILATPHKDNDYKGRSFYYSSNEQFIRAAKKGGLSATAYDPPLNQDNSRLNTDL